MSDFSTVQVRTQDNIDIDLEPAGLGTRFTAWVLDMFYMAVFGFVLVIGALVIAVSLGRGGNFLLEEEDPDLAVALVFSVIIFISTFLSLLYFGLFEWWMNGQTPGKRSMRIRTIQEDGLPPSGRAIFLRTVFRIVDHFPLAWLVPFASKRTLRLGDMVAGTIVVGIQSDELRAVRMRLANRTSQEVDHRIDAGRLKRLQPEDFTKIEQILERLDSLPLALQTKLLRDVSSSLAKRLEVLVPEPISQKKFLEDLLSEEYRRRSRRLG